MKTVRVAIVGAGAMAREHARAFASLPEVELCGITSRTPEKAEALALEHSIDGVFQSVAEVIEKAAPDLFVVTVPPLVMRDTANACFVSDAGVLLEKPPGYHLADAEAIEAMAARLGRRVWVGLNRRAYSSTRRAIQALDAIEAPRFIVVHDQQDLELARRLGHPDEIVDHWMFGNSIHLVDYLRIFGRGRIIGIQNILRWNRERPGPVCAAVEFESGDAALYICAWNAPGPWAVTVTTEAARWELRPLEQALVQERGSRAVVALPPDEADVSFKAGILEQARRAIAAVQDQPSALPTIGEAIETMRLIREIYA